jgi:hypothetical protein
MHKRKGKPKTTTRAIEEIMGVDWGRTTPAEFQERVRRLADGGLPRQRLIAPRPARSCWISPDEEIQFFTPRNCCCTINPASLLNFPFLSPGFCPPVHAKREGAGMG